MKNLGPLSLVGCLSALLVGAATPGCGCSHNGGASDGGGGGEVDLSDGTGVDMAGAGCGLVPCASAGAGCGPIGDGCGGVIDCGSCASPQTCGGGGTPFQCGGSAACKPTTCAALGFNCGFAGDGCGGVINCGTCTSGACGAGKPNVCGTGGMTGVSQCPNNGVTTISGTVVAPTDPTAGFGNPDPIYNATVYVPSGPLNAITTGATCDQCTMSQGALVSAVTGIDGKFTLTNPPTGSNVTVVIQLGKWRRVLTLSVTPCMDNPLTTAQTRLPRKQAEFSPYDNIPRFAIDTGNVDVMECVLRKMGIADSEFTNPALSGGLPTATGRVQIYQAAPAANGAGGAVIDATTPTEDQLWGSQTTLDAYDAVLFPCEGAQDNESTTQQGNVINYANLGGRVFATHFSYVWLYNIAPFSSTATWAINTANYNGSTFNGLIDQTFPKGAALAQWLQQAAVAASTTLGIIPVSFVRHDFNLPLTNAQRWMYMQNAAPGNGPANFPVHYTFNTPVGAAAANQCGRVVFSDFHVENSNGSQGVLFPQECSAGPLTPQEKLLEFMLFDLTSCVTPDQPPACVPQTCAQIPATCGMQSDGCGGLIDCGACAMGQSCGGGGSPNQCGSPNCTPTTCQAANAQCGIIGDGCGGTIDCGTCTTGTCGAGGPNLCGGLIP